MLKKDKAERQVQVAFRLPPSLVDRIDDYALRMSALHPGIVFTRADAVRTLLTMALDRSPTDSDPRNSKARR